MPTLPLSDLSRHPAKPTTRERSRVEDVHRTDLRDVLVASAAHAEQHRLVFRPSAALRRDPAHGVRRLERRDDALQATQQLEAPERLVIGNRNVFSAATVLEERMLRPNA